MTLASYGIISQVTIQQMSFQEAHYTDIHNDREGHLGHDFKHPGRRLLSSSAGSCLNPGSVTAICMMIAIMEDFTSRLSSLHILQRVIVYCLQFIHSCDPGHKITSALLRRISGLQSGQSSSVFKGIMIKHNKAYCQSSIM
jgi:hypothetical protein